MVDTTKRLESVIEDAPEENNLIPPQTDKDYVDEELDNETRCGLGPLKPDWLQMLASKKAYVVLYGVIGATEFALSSYFIGTISTMEKRFKIPSQTSGLINSAWDIGSICATLVVAYMGSAGHKPRWVAWGTCFTALSCYMRLIPHWLYGPGEDALAVTEEFGAANSFRQFTYSESANSSGPLMSLCGNNHTDSEDCNNASSGYTSSAILFLAQAVSGVGSAIYYTLGLAYMDDNARKNKTPMLLAIWQCLRMVGPTLGYMFASYALEIFVAPDLTPTIDSKDPRWVGAWWYGWNTFGLSMMLLAVAIAMFPRSLPRTTQRNIAAATAKGQAYMPNHTERRSLANFKKVLMRLLKNKILVCNTMSTICFTFGLIGQWVFMPKYMETQFHQSASTANLISGSVGLLCAAAGVITSAAVISYFKPGPRTLAAWNVIVEFCDVLGYITIVFIGCDPFILQGTPKPDGTLGLGVDCNANCSCPDSLRYSPVCDARSGTTFFSACHAGCGIADWISANSSTKAFSNCSCVVDGGPVMDGPCPVDCNTAFMMYIIVQCIQRFLSASGRAGNTLIHFRCVTPDDKPTAIGISEFLLCGCSFIPGPIVFGILIDMSCIVWGRTCGETGNCWLYDVKKLRYYVNIPIVGCLFLGTLWDIGVWYHVKGLSLYDDNDSENRKAGTTAGRDEARAAVALVAGSEMSLSVRKSDERVTALN